MRKLVPLFLMAASSFLYNWLGQPASAQTLDVDYPENVPVQGYKTGATSGFDYRIYSEFAPRSIETMTMKECALKYSDGGYPANVHPNRTVVGFSAITDKVVTAGKGTFEPKSNITYCIDAQDGTVFTFGISGVSKNDGGVMDLSNITPLP